MAGFQFSKLLYLFLFMGAIADIGVGEKHYVEYTLSDERLCSPIRHKKELPRLTSEKNAAVVVKPSFRFDRWQPLCRFVFKAAKGEFMFVVIQNMYLRRNGSECLDYVKFKRKDKHQTEPFCGRLDRRIGLNMQGQQRSIWELNSEGTIPQGYAEYDTDGEIETEIYLSSAPLGHDEKLDITLVYTPYKDCNKIKVDRDEYQRFEVPKANSSICMWKGYVCDGYQNCVDEICRDEDNCRIVSNGTGTKVTIGAVTTMLLCFIIFVMGLWICRRHKKMCWSSDCAGPSAHDNRLARAEREAASSANPSVAVAPMLEVAVVPTVLDKDLPPSYDSLFPEQANPSTT